MPCLAVERWASRSARDHGSARESSITCRRCALPPRCGVSLSAVVRLSRVARLLCSARSIGSVTPVSPARCGERRGRHLDRPAPLHQLGRDTSASELEARLWSVAPRRRDVAMSSARASRPEGQGRRRCPNDGIGVPAEIAAILTTGSSVDGPDPRTHRAARERADPAAGSGQRVIQIRVLPTEDHVVAGQQLVDGVSCRMTRLCGRSPDPTARSPTICGRRARPRRPVDNR